MIRLMFPFADFFLSRHFQWPFERQFCYRTIHHQRLWRLNTGTPQGYAKRDCFGAALWAQ